MYHKSSDATGAEEHIGQLPGVLTDWSKDGRFILGSYDASQGPTRGDLFLLPVAGPIRLLALLATAAMENGAHFSFDGRFVAYRSDESGRAELYVRSFNSEGPVPSVGPATQVTHDGASLSARWRNDDQELYYLSVGGNMMAVPIATNPIRVGAAKVLFRPPQAFVTGTPGPTPSSDISADGQRFVLLLPMQ